MPETPYNQADLIQLIGQCTVELAYLRAQIAALQARVAELEVQPSNGVATLPTGVPNPA